MLRCKRGTLRSLLPFQFFHTSAKRVLTQPLPQRSGYPLPGGTGRVVLEVKR